MGLKERADAVIDAALGSRIVGCVVLINEAGKRVYARSAGYADREAATPIVENSMKVGIMSAGKGIMMPPSRARKIPFFPGIRIFEKP